MNVCLPRDWLENRGIQIRSINDTTVVVIVVVIVIVVIVIIVIIVIVIVIGIVVGVKGVMKINYLCRDGEEFHVIIHYIIGRFEGQSQMLDIGEID